MNVIQYIHYEDKFCHMIHDVTATNRFRTNGSKFERLWIWHESIMIVQTKKWAIRKRREWITASDHEVVFGDVSLDTKSDVC